MSNHLYQRFCKECRKRERHIGFRCTGCQARAIANKQFDYVYKRFKERTP
jgi:hypothetical protein